MKRRETYMKKITKIIAPVMIITAMLSGCMEPSEIEKQTQAKMENAMNVMAQTKVPIIHKSLERENIRQRILVSNDPNTLLWIYPMSAGRVIGRFPVKGKVTSGSKRLTPSTGYDFDTSATVELPDEMGTYGSSGDYIFWFDPAGNFHQHKGDYFLSTVPYKIDLGYGTITMEIDKQEEAKRTEYEKQMEQTNQKMKELSIQNEKLGLKGGANQ
jgi:hypothetical protein